MSKSGHDEKKNKKEKEKREEKGDTHEFENKLLSSDSLAGGFASPGTRTLGASLVSLG
jgi:hypothetical protein